MNQQQDMFYGGAYTMTNSNRSPSSSRPGYATSSGLQPPNRPPNNQRPLDPIGQPSPSVYGDDRFNSYDGAFRHRLQPNQGFPDGFVVPNSQPWTYNPGAATVNGAMSDAGRLRSGNRRGPLPSVRATPSPCWFFFSPCSLAFLFLFPLQLGLGPSTEIIRKIFIFFFRL